MWLVLILMVGGAAGLLGLLWIKTGRDEKIHASQITETRRKFLATGKNETSAVAREAIDQLLQWSAATVTGKTRPRSTLILLPPGALSREEYVRVCDGCLKCVDACPTGVLGLSPGSMLTFVPTMRMDIGCCIIDCTACGDACPTGAITRLSHEERIRKPIGKVRWIKRNCSGTKACDEDGACRRCEGVCPTGALHVYEHGDSISISVTAELCIGCGLCSWNCPALPRALYVDAVHSEFVPSLLATEEERTSK